MKKLSTLVLSFAVVLGVSGLAAAQGRSQGKPPQTGIEHAETVANSEGVQHGIENAESKQGKTDNESQETSNKSKQKKHHHKKHNDKKS